MVITDHLVESKGVEHFPEELRILAFRSPQGGDVVDGEQHTPLTVNLLRSALVPYPKRFTSGVPVEYGLALLIIRSCRASEGRSQTMIQGAVLTGE